MLTTDDIEKLKAEHGPDLIAVSSPKGDLVFKRPSRAVWTDFIDSLAKDRASKEVVIRRLALACAVQPAADKMVEIFETYPALPANIVNELSDLAGTGATFEVKKL